MSVDFDGLGYRFQDALCDSARVRGMRNPGKEQREFVSAYPRNFCAGARGQGVPDAITGSHLIVDPIGDDLQDPIARGVTKGVIDDLETIDIEDQDGDEILAQFRVF